MTQPPRDTAELQAQVDKVTAEKNALYAELQHLRGVVNKPPAYAEPRDIRDPKECQFYHVMDIPGHGPTKGQWDLRGREQAYFGGVDFAGKRVLEVGTASGYLCFYMERMGAEVVSYDLSHEHDWDIVPYANRDFSEQIKKRRAAIRKLNNSWWFAHRAFGSKARVVYGTVYDIPPNLGRFDICTFGSILLHLRDPFLALQRAVQNVTGTVIVTDLMLPFSEKQRELIKTRKLLQFVPDAAAGEPWETWWKLSPELVSEYLKILGFQHQTVSYHQQLSRPGGNAKEIDLYTIVARRE